MLSEYYAQEDNKGKGKGKDRISKITLHDVLARKVRKEENGREEEEIEQMRD